MLLACRAIPTKQKKDCTETKLWFLLKSPVIHCTGLGNETGKFQNIKKIDT